MATATAKRGRGKAPKRKAPPPPPPPKKKKRACSKRGQGKTAPPQKFLEKVLAEDPQLTSDQFVIKFQLPVEEVARHKMFVLQFMLDYNVKAAAMRMGYPEQTAKDAGKLMLNYPYSQLFLSELQRAKTLETVITVGQLASKIVEELYRPDIVLSGCAMSNSSTRLSAGKLLAQMLGLLNPKPKEEVIPIRRIMFVGNEALKSAGSNVEGWGNVAVSSQKRLKASTAIDV